MKILAAIGIISGSAIVAVSFPREDYFGVVLGLFIASAVQIYKMKRGKSNE